MLICYIMWNRIKNKYCKLLILCPLLYTVSCSSSLLYTCLILNVRNIYILICLPYYKAPIFVTASHLGDYVDSIIICRPATPWTWVSVVYVSMYLDLADRTHCVSSIYHSTPIAPPSITPIVTVALKPSASVALFFDFFVTPPILSIFFLRACPCLRKWVTNNKLPKYPYQWLI